MKDYPRTARINVQLQREVAELIRESMTDPKVAAVSVTRADVSPDLRNASIYVSSLGSDEELASAVEALQRVASGFRRELGTRLRLRRIPALKFRADVQMRQAERLDRLIRSAVNQDAANARDRDPE